MGQRIPKRPHERHTSSGHAPDAVPSSAVGGVLSGLHPQEYPPEDRNKKALAVVNRVRDKLTGRDFGPNFCLNVQGQVDLLIRQATSNENLCQCYIGWCPFW